MLISRFLAATWNAAPCYSFRRALMACMASISAGICSRSFSTASLFACSTAVKNLRISASDGCLVLSAFEVELLLDELGEALELLETLDAEAATGSSTTDDVTSFVLESALLLDVLTEAAVKSTGVDGLDTELELLDVALLLDTVLLLKKATTASSNALIT